MKEAIPPKEPEPRGKEVDLRIFVDSDHAGYKLTKRSRTLAMKESLTGHVPSVDNPAEICTKVVPCGSKWKHLIGKVLHDLYEQ